MHGWVNVTRTVWQRYCTSVPLSPVSGWLSHPTPPEVGEEIKKLSGDFVLSPVCPIAGELLAEDLGHLQAVHLVLFQEGIADHNLHSLFLLTTPDLRRSRRKLFSLLTFCCVSRKSKVFARILNISEQTITTPELTRGMTSGFENLISPLFLTESRGVGRNEVEDLLCRGLGIVSIFDVVREEASGCRTASPPRGQQGRGKCFSC